MSAAGPMDVAWLKSPDVRAWRQQDDVPPGHLPYRIDLLEEHGFRLRWTDAHHRRAFTAAPVARVVRRLEGVGAPFVQTMALGPRLASAPVTLAMFESEGNLLAWLRASRFPGSARTKLVVIACWLADLLPSMPPRALARYRRAYAHVDRLLFFSENQREVYERWLGLAPDRLHLVPFGVDTEYFEPRPDAADGAYVLSVGRDRGRDWPTFLAAAARAELPVKVLARPAELSGLTIPANVDVLGYVERRRYRELLAGARVVALSLQEKAYPTGQSVLLEASAMARPVVVSETTAMRAYVRAGETAVVVPRADAAGLAEGIRGLWEDAPARDRIGSSAKDFVDERWTAGHLWSAVARQLHDVVSR